MRSVFNVPKSLVSPCIIYRLSEQNLNWTFIWNHSFLFHTRPRPHPTQSSTLSRKKEKKKRFRSETVKLYEREYLVFFSLLLLLFPHKCSVLRLFCELPGVGVLYWLLFCQSKKRDIKRNAFYIFIYIKYIIS